MAKGRTAEEKDVVVIGAGLAGYKASQDLAQLGLEVLLMDREPHMGGTLDQHEHWFPTDDCSWCKTLPLFAGDSISERCLRRQLDQPGIELAPATRLQRLSGKRGRFTLKLVHSINIVDPDRCTACDRCAQVCPVEVTDEFEGHLHMRKAAFIRHPLAVPSTYAIDLETCIHCGECEKICPTGAISFEREGDSQERKVNAKAVILSTGFKGLDPRSLPQYRYAEHPDIYTNTQFERHLYGREEPVRRSDGAPMKRVAILHCIGSRDHERDYCSTGCCMISVKEALMVKERDPEAEVTLFYMDMRDQVRDGHAYYHKALKAGVRTVRSRPSSVELAPNGELIVVYADDNEGLMSEPFDAVVLQVAQAPHEDMADLVDAAGVEMDRHGFVARSPGTATETSRQGVFVAGSVGGPKDIPDTVTEAASAAMEAALVAGIGEEEASEASSCPARGKEPAVALLVCTCHGELDAAIDLRRLLEHAEGLPRVVAAREVSMICKGGGRIEEALAGLGANRLIVASCPDYQWRREALAEAGRAGIQPDLVEFIDMREWLSWVNTETDGATRKAQSLVAMSSERVRTAIPRASTTVPVDDGRRALVVGGGVAGMTAALDIAAAGFTTDLVEKRDVLGGNVLDIPLTARGADAKHMLSDIQTRVKAEKGVQVLYSTEVSDVEGAVGAFRVTLLDRKSKDEQVRTYGAIVLATGGARNLPKEYGLRELDGVMDHFGLEDNLVSGDEAPEDVVIIQCAGSREKNGLPYCSRVCCARAIHNARKVMAVNPDARVTVLNRDIVTYGTLEELYTVARDEGVRFIRFSEDAKPDVAEGKDGRLVVKVIDPGLDETITLDADAVVLSTGVVPRPQGKLFGMLRTEEDPHGFLAVPNTKFRPVDAFRDGIYACGLMTGPKIAEESLASAHAAAARAVTVLRRTTLPARVGISTVNHRTCSACGLCVSQCPFQARYLDPKDGKARVDEAACWGCGVCAQVCPNASSSMATRSERQAIHQVDAAVWHD